MLPVVYLIKTNVIAIFNVCLESSYPNYNSRNPCFGVIDGFLINYAKVAHTVGWYSFISTSSH